MKTSNIEVTGTFGGFFAAGGAFYYVGAVLIGLIAAVLLGLLVMAMRSGRGDDDWDDDYDDDDDEDEPRSSRGPSGPAPGPSGPAPSPSGPASKYVLVHQIRLLKRRKRRKIPVGWSIIEPMMMEPNGRKAKMRRGTTENPDKAIGLSGRTR